MEGRRPARLTLGRIWLLLFLALGGVAGGAGPTFGARTAQAGRLTNTITNTYTLADLGLRQVEQGIVNDRGLLLGGIGSDLWHQPGGPADEFWMITDRGPNGQIKVNGANRRTFPVPDFNPVILQVRVSGSAITILQTIPILTQSGRPVTGLSNLAGHDETPYDYTAQVELPFNQNGIDSEGLVRAADGTFWVVEEYGPSLLHIAADGKVIKRWQPAGLPLPEADYPVETTLPAILGLRKGNRGFEGIGISPDGRTIFAIVQSPLANPDAATGDPSRLTRIIAFSTVSETVTAEYVYQFEPAANFDPAHPAPAEMKASSLIALDADTLLIQERTDWVARLYLAKLSSATNILGTKWDDRATTPSLEALTDPAAAGIAVLPKTLRLDLEQLPNMPDKIEGVALVGCTQLAVANDNDFDIGTFDQSGNNVGTGSKSRLLLISLDAPVAPDCAPAPSPRPSTAPPSPPATGTGGYLPGLPATGAGGGGGGGTALGGTLLATLLSLTLLRRAARRRA